MALHVDHLAALLDSDWTAERLHRTFGAIPLWRVIWDPPPGTATEQDAVDLDLHHDRLCELVDGVLIHKTGELYYSWLTGVLSSEVTGFVREHGLGVVLAGSAMMRLAPGVVRIPDASYFAWSRFPGRRLPDDPVCEIVPDLAMEIISPANTPEEMTRKLKEYFDAGVRLVWYVYPVQREVHVFRSAEDCAVLRDGDTLEGGDVLPGFSLSLTTFFNSGVRPE